MASYKIVPAEPEHVLLLREALREDDAREITCLGVTVRKGLWRSFRNSIMRKSVFVDGKMAAMWGLSGDIISKVGNPWLMTTAEIEKVPVSFLREARNEVQKMLDVRHRLVNYVAADYKKAVRFVSLVGFTQAETVSIAGHPFHVFTMERS